MKKMMLTVSFFIHVLIYIISLSKSVVRSVVSECEIMKNSY